MALFRIGLVVPALPLGGGVPAVARFVKDVALRDGRYELRVVSLSSSARDAEGLRVASPSSWWRGVGTSEGVWEGLPFMQIGAFGSEFEFQRYRPRRVLAQALSGCDLIQVVCGSPAWASSVLGLGKPVAMHVATRARVERRLRDGNARGFTDLWRKAMTEITDRMDDMALRQVDAIQVMNPWMLEYASEINMGRRIDLRYAPPGVDADLFRPLDRRAQMKRSYILCVGRLSDPRKNITLLLEAFAKLAPSLRDEARLVLAGSSGPPEAFWSRVEALGVREQVSFVSRPEPDTLVRLYQGASVLVSSSDEEGFGVVLLEAMACGVPVISTRSGGPDGIITDGEDGFLVPLGDASAMSARLARVLQEPALNIQMGDRARQTIERRYDERVAGEAFIDIWQRMAHKAGIV